MIKRTTIIILATLLLIGSYGCSSPSTGKNAFEGVALEKLLEDIYSNIDDEMPVLVNQEITAENEQYFLGTSGLDIKEAIASEPMISAIAYSLCLVRLNDCADVEAAKKSIAENADPAKWICVRAESQNVRVESAGNVIMLIMSNEYADAVQKSFNELAAK